MPHLVATADLVDAAAFAVAKERPHTMLIVVQGVAASIFPLYPGQFAMMGSPVIPVEKPEEAEQIVWHILPVALLVMVAQPPKWKTDRSPSLILSVF